MKISNVKRSQHIKHKKNYARPAKKQASSVKNSKTIEKQLATSKKVFGKPTGPKKSAISLPSSVHKGPRGSSEPAVNGKVGKQTKHGKQSTKPTSAAASEQNGHSTSQNGNEMDEEDIRDLMEMIEDEDDELLQRSKRRKKEAAQSAVAVDDSAVHEKEHAHQRSTDERSRKMRTVDLLPIKTKFGELITRQTEVEIKEKPIEQSQSDVDDDGEGNDDGEIFDSDDDIVNDDANGLAAAAAVPVSDKAISTADLLILREQEVARQKYRIGIICSGILEKPEDKMKNFNALFELMDERHNDTPNLFSVRKIATMSLLEVFKDILPEYRIGQIDLKTQKGMSRYLI